MFKIVYLNSLGCICISLPGIWRQRKLDYSLEKKPT